MPCPHTSSSEEGQRTATRWVVTTICEPIALFDNDEEHNVAWGHNYSED
jgi:hypothetical protein